jgi:hypothetical protein
MRARRRSKYSRLTNGLGEVRHLYTSEEGEAPTIGAPIPTGR